MNLSDNPKIRRMQVWLAAWTHTAGSNSCVHINVPTRYADRCLQDFDQRFRSEEQDPPSREIGAARFKSCEVPDAVAAVTYLFENISCGPQRPVLDKGDIALFLDYWVHGQWPELKKAFPDFDPKITNELDAALKVLDDLGYPHGS